MGAEPGIHGRRRRRLFEQLGFGGERIFFHDGEGLRLSPLSFLLLYGYMLRCHVSVGMGETNGTPGGDAPILGRGSL